jgi:hypothetical protein
LQVTLDAPLPASLSVGGGTVLLVCGTCFDLEAEIASLRFTVQGTEQAVWAHGMPRLDYFRALHPGLDPYSAADLPSDPGSPQDPLLRSYRSGFWGFVKVGPDSGEGPLELGLRAQLDCGATQTSALGAVLRAAAPVDWRVDETDRLESLLAQGPAEPVAICLATYEPPLDLLARQLDSIRDQTHSNWVCLISDDCSAPDRFRAIAELVEGDPRFVLSRSGRRLGFYQNFERALGMAPAGARYVALADQDDFWYPEKLHTLLGEIGGAQLVYSDARIVDVEGREIAPTYWGVRHNNHSDLVSLLVANSVTGAASLFRRELLDYALPFPPPQFAHFHDHWLGLTALALGGIEFVARPLYDYVQHERAALGHAKATQVTTLRQRLGRVRGEPRERVRVYRTRYFVDLLRVMAFASILEVRCGPHMSPRQRRELRRFLSLERSPAALAWFAARAVRELSGAPETLGAEWALLQSLLWRRALAASVSRYPRRRLRLDAVPPPNLAPVAGVRIGPGAEGPRVLAEKIAPLDLAVSDDAPRRLNILIPTIDLEHFFGGYIAKFNLARRLAERGALVRILTVDPVGPLPRKWRSTVESYSGLAGLFERVEVAFGRQSGRLEVSRGDRFVATTWWTAHIAQAALQELGRQGFAYLIQEYEPMTFPMGSHAALANQSYSFPHFGLFSSQLLREYFQRHAVGVYEAGQVAGEKTSVAFENAITDTSAPSVGELAARGGRRLLFYARPEPHAARNMFELGVLALQHAAEDGLLRDGWTLHGIGGVGGRRQVRLADRADLELLPRTGQDEYARLLPSYDVGLALMYTPHPSLVPIEMACAGLITVTNTFENKTAQALAGISENLIAGPPSIAGIAHALGQAAGAAGDFERRVRGSEVRWSRDWNKSFSDELLERLEDYLAR